MDVFWFRRDLRLNDNVGLYHALRGGNDVLPIFIFDDEILSQLPADDSRVSFIHHLLEKINGKLQENQRSLAVFYGKPIDVFKQIITENKIETVYTNHDYEPYARKRDLDIFHLLKEHDVAFKTSKDQVIFDKSEVVKDDGSPYVVFTPYSNKWKTLLVEQPITLTDSENLLSQVAVHSYPFLSLSDIHFTPSPTLVPDIDNSDELIAAYQSTRNFPKLRTSRVGPHLRFGSISIRELALQASRHQNVTFLNELIWREFFMQILWHFPHTINKGFRPQYDSIQWRNNEDEFKKWCDGMTGYPIVDAGMRELNATGFMHNRVRMITAGFLCKHLLIDWRWGEAYFALKLMDYDQSSNVGNWQWAAGSGVDAAPYFRIFNPSEQVKKFDKDLEYVQHWVPELDSDTYPQPIVEHKFARERCLQVYKDALL